MMPEDYSLNLRKKRSFERIQMKASWNKEFELIRVTDHIILWWCQQVKSGFWREAAFNMATHIDLTDRKKDEEKIHAASLYTRSW